MISYLCMALAGTLYWAGDLPKPEFPEKEPPQIIDVAKDLSDVATPAAAPAVTRAKVMPRLLDISRREVSVSAPSAPVAAGQAPGTQQAVYVVTGTAVNLRHGPSTREAVTGRVTRGEEVVVTELLNSGWASIRRVSDGSEGFMAAKFLAPAR